MKTLPLVCLAIALLPVIGCRSYQPPAAPSLSGSGVHPAPPSPPAAPAPTSEPAPASPGAAIVGRYSLEIAGWGPSCDAVPEHARRRTYSAEIHDLGDTVAVKLFDAQFLSGGSCRDPRLPQAGTPSCNQFLASREGDMWSFHIGSENEFDGNEIWEGLPDGYLLQIIGDATGRAKQDGEIQAMGPGGFWYGDGRPASHFVGCRTDYFRLTFSPR